MPRRLQTLACVLACLTVLWLAPATSAGQPADEFVPAENKKEARQRAKEERIAEYLRKKEQRLAERETRRSEQQAADAEAAAMKEQAHELEQAEKAAETERQRATGAATVVAAETASAEDPAPQEFDLPPKIRRAQEVIRRTKLGKDPTVAAYLDLVDRSAASPQQLAALGNFLAQANMAIVGLEYYRLALRMDKADPTLWVNVGTIHRQLGELGPAISAYHEALRIDITNATAHYNLGATLDQQGKYDDALQEYKLALTLDPTLADPGVNPQAANNELMMAVQLLLYREQAGNLGLPLLEVAGGELEAIPDTP